MSIRPCEQLLCLCAWDYLSDTILLTDTRGCVSKEKYGPATIVCSTICYALSYLFRYADNDTSTCSTDNNAFHQQPSRKLHIYQPQGGGTAKCITAPGEDV